MPCGCRLGTRWGLACKDLTLAPLPGFLFSFSVVYTLYYTQNSSANSYLASSLALTYASTVLFFVASVYVQLDLMRVKQ